MKTLVLIIFLLIFSTITKSQTVGGNSAFSFINQPNTAQLSALGGVNISSIGNDVGLSFSNPALLRNEMHQQLNASFNNFLAGVKNYSLSTGFHLAKANTNLGFGINYFNYGIIPQTDAIGNVYGTFSPNDYVVQVNASKQYKEHFWLGSTLKFISSSYGQY
ncbi:MAG: hypothetical protein H7068_07045, partial [Pedobacter sp.]|nr:hypothetical protein [Chitinophagaceae bacterium]